MDVKKTKKKSQVDPMPLVIAGVETMQCECGWETSILVPEESRILLVKVLEHIQQHGIELPQFRMQIH